MRLILSMVALLAGSSFGSSAEPSKKPNVVFFIADDLSLSDCSTYGGQDVPTPNIARLAKAGMTFTQAFVVSPSCAPSRAALLTGLAPMQNGAMLNHARPKPSLKKWPAYFQDLGYEVVAIGKVAHYAQVTDYGFDHVSHFKYHEDACIAEGVKWLSARTSAKPLCFLVGTNWPHVPWPTDGLYPNATLPPTFVPTLETRYAWSRYLAAVANADRDLGLLYDAAVKKFGSNLLFAFSSDHGAQIPFGKWNCYDSGVQTPLIISWPNHVKPDSRSSAMVSWIDLLPTMVEACGDAAPADLSGSSFLKVLRGKADAHRDKIFLTHSGDGKMNRYPIRAVRTTEWKYIRNLNPTAKHTTHIDLGNVGTDGRGYFDSWVALAKTDTVAASVVQRYHTRPAEELYDLSADRWETKNVANDPQHAARLKTLRADLDEWMKANGDRGLETENNLPNPQAKKAKE